ncbi:MAG: crotonase/enoyl-CoA hydratase family protein [Acidimicrobiales bacterium]|jgi:enoyl-CoA hydratase|nr:crotonase/enoyl-CoA hydratase family protein [Acidimicrobiales bacterium]
MTTYECFDVTVSDHVAHVVLKRGEQMNTMIPAFWRELPEIVHAISDEGHARAIVLSSTGRHFSAGMDLAVFTGGGAGGGGIGTPGGADATEIGRVRANLRVGCLHLQDSFTALERARMPVLAAIQGGCVGGAVDMVTAADCRYATRDAWFCIQEINIGMTADVGTLQRLPKLIPEGIVRQIAYTGERLSAERALQLGLVNELFDDHASLVEGVLRIAGQIAKNSPLAVWGSKEMLNYSRDHSVADGLNYIATWQTGMFQPSDMLECFTAKAEGRDPEFPDLAPVRRGL